MFMLQSMIRVVRGQIKMGKNYDYTHIFDGVYAPVTEYTPLPMTEQMFWRRIGWLQQAMIRADNFEFRLLWFHKLQELMRLQP
jgi:hypothetical protein